MSISTLSSQSPEPQAIPSHVAGIDVNGKLQTLTDALLAISDRVAILEEQLKALQPWDTHRDARLMALEVKTGLSIGFAADAGATGERMDGRTCVTSAAMEPHPDGSPLPSVPLSESQFWHY